MFLCDESIQNSKGGYVPFLYAFKSDIVACAVCIVLRVESRLCPQMDLTARRQPLMIIEFERPQYAVFHEHKTRFRSVNVDL